MSDQFCWHANLLLIIIVVDEMLDYCLYDLFIQFDRVFLLTYMREVTRIEVTINQHWPDVVDIWVQGVDQIMRESRVFMRNVNMMYTYIMYF